MFSDKASLYVSRLGAGARIRKRSTDISRSSALARSTAFTHTESLSVSMDTSLPSGSNRPRSADCQSTGNATVLPSSGSLVLEKSDSGLSHVSAPVSVVSTALLNGGPPLFLVSHALTLRLCHSEIRRPFFGRGREQRPGLMFHQCNVAWNGF